MSTKNTDYVERVDRLARQFMIPLTLSGQDYGVSQKSLHTDTGSITGNLPPDSNLFLGDNLQLKGISSVSVFGKNNAVLIGKNTKLNQTKIHINGNNCIVLISNGCRIGNVTKFFATGENSIIILGANTTIESGILLSSLGQTILFGEDCMCSNDILVRTSDAHGIWDLETGESLSEPQPVIIGNHVWLGNSARVSKGVRIGDGAIIGQLGLATKDVPPRTLNVGVPTRSIRSGVSWSRGMTIDGVPDFIRRAQTSG